jgi:hypothetical protein
MSSTLSNVSATRITSCALSETIERPSTQVLAGHAPPVEFGI